MEKRNTKLVRVLVAFREGIADGCLTYEGWVLPVRAVAEALGISPVTAVKAIRCLKAEGVLVGERRRRARVASVEGSLVAVRRSQRSWETTRDRIAATLLSDMPSQHAGAMSVKGLSVRHGVSVRTIARALDALAGDGLLVRKGNRYAPAHPTPPLARGRIVFLGEATYNAVIELRHLGESFLHKMEAACARSCLGLEVIGHRSPGESIEFVDASDRLTALPIDEGVMGYCVVVTGRQSVPPLLAEALQRIRKPIAVLDAFGNRRAKHRLASKQCVFEFSEGTHRSKAVGRYLLAKGHRRVAYFSSFHKLEWSQARLDGLTRAFADAGLPHGVVPFTLDNMSGIWDFYVGAQAACDVESHMAAAEAFYAKWHRGVPESFARAFDGVLRWPLQLTAMRCEVARLLTEKFEQALADTTITAWVGSNDEVAIEAAQFLRTRGIQVPEAIAVAGFDNTADGLKHGITSYDFNAEGTISAIVNYLLRPSATSHYLGRDRIEIPGYVVERRSTGVQAG